MNINVGSWNIWVYGSRDFKGIASVIRENNIDIIGIQEAAIYHDGNKPINSAEEIAKELNYNFVFFPSVDARPRKPWTLGNAILSRFPIVESSSYPLNLKKTNYDGSPQKEQRIAVFAKIKINPVRNFSPQTLTHVVKQRDTISNGINEILLNFFTTHLQFSVGLNTTEVRLKQVENLLSVIKKCQTQIILTGDFNAVQEKEEINLIQKQLQRLGNNEPTWTVKPGDFHGWKVDTLSYQIDNIFISEDIKAKNFQVLKSDLSDHLPIKVTITL